MGVLAKKNDMDTNSRSDGTLAGPWVNHNGRLASIRSKMGHILYMPRIGSDGSNGSSATLGNRFNPYRYLPNNSYDVESLSSEGGSSTLSLLHMAFHRVFVPDPRTAIPMGSRFNLASTWLPLGVSTVREGQTLSDTKRNEPRLVEMTMAPISLIPTATVKIVALGMFLSGALGFILEGVTSGSSIWTALAASAMTAAALLIGIVLKGWVAKKETNDKNARTDAMHATGSADKIVEVLAEYRTHIDQMMTDHMTRVQEFYGSQIKELQIIIAQRDSVIELQKTLIAELKVLPKNNA